MGLRNTTDSWGGLSKSLHWLTALLIIGILILGAVMGDFPKPFRYTLYAIHKSMGVTILLLMVMRLIWRFFNPTPALPEKTPRWQKAIGHGSHGLIYLALIIMPLTGIAMSTAFGRATSFWWLFSFNMPFIHASKPLANFLEQAHETIAWIIVALLALHLLGALKHYIKDKDNVLQRMLPCPKKR